jgi:hypothetical protein
MHELPEAARPAYKAFAEAELNLTFLNARDGQ